MKEKKEHKKKKIASNIIILGLVSCFTDISSEMVYPILPIYLTAILGASPAIIGIIEGIAESLASILKLFSGVMADKYNNKKQLAFFGYFAGFFNKIVILFSASWGGILFARVVDKFGKGVRTAPRDSLVAESAEEGELGKAYGTHKTLDLLGAAIGTLIAFFLISLSSENYKTIFIISMIPAIIGLVCILFVKDNHKKNEEPKKLNFTWKGLDRRLKLFLVIIFIFTLRKFFKCIYNTKSKQRGIFNSRSNITVFCI